MINSKNKPPIKVWTILYPDGNEFTPSDKEKEVVSSTFELFRRAQQDRDRAYTFFDGMNLVNYIEDSVERFNTNLYLRDGMEDWQAGFNDSFTRNKVLAVLGRIIEQLPIASAIPRGEEDVLRAQIITDLYQYTEELDDYSNKMSRFVLEAITKGTAIGYEDFEYQKKKIREPKGKGETFAVNETVIKTTKFYTELVPLEEYYPASVSIEGVKDQPYAFRRQLMDIVDFRNKFAHYKKAELINGHQSSQREGGSIPYYLDYISSDVGEGQVEFIRFYDAMNDQYIMVANGIWLNPLGDTEEVQPLPWAHKEQPFYSTIFEPFGKFFYGKSLPSKLSSMQDILNVLQNMMMDQSFLSIFTPIITAGFDDFEDDFLRPGRRTSIDTGGLALSSAIMPLQFPTPNGWHQYILEYTRRIMEEASMDKVNGGVAGQGADRTTAFEVQVAAAGVASVLTMFAQMINSAIKRKATLRIKNVLQFGFQPNATIIPGVLADTDTTRPFTTISMNGVRMTDGKRGSRVIELFRNEEALPNPENVRARASISTAEQGSPVEIVAIAPSYIRNVDFDIKLGLDPKREESTQAEQALLLQKAQVLSQIGGERINMDEIITKIALSMDLDPAKILNDGVLNPQEQQQEGQGIPGIGGQQQGAAQQQLAQQAQL